MVLWNAFHPYHIILKLIFDLSFVRDIVNSNIFNTIEMADMSTSEPTATAKRKGRATKQNAEAYCLVLSLAWNDIVINGGKISAKQQEELIKVKAAQWLPELRTSYAHTQKVSADPASILSEIDNDSGEGMIRKAKSIVHYINNVLNPHWKDPSSFASGNQLSDALLVCRKAAWTHNETERIKLKAKDKTVVSDMAPRAFDLEWTFKEYPCFRFLGLPAGDRGCLGIFRTPLSGSGPSQLSKKSASEIRDQLIETGSRDQRRLCGLKTAAIKNEEILKAVENEDAEISFLKEGVMAQQEMTNQVAWNNEMKRLQTVLELAQSLDLPAEKIQEHKMNLYNFANLPCPKSILKLPEETSKVQKRDARSTPASAIMASTETTLVNSRVLGIDQPRFDNLVSSPKVCEIPEYLWAVGHVHEHFSCVLFSVTVIRTV